MIHLDGNALVHLLLLVWLFALGWANADHRIKIAELTEKIEELEERIDE